MRRSKQRDSADGVAIRNLDAIREEAPGAKPSKAGALVMASFGGACIVLSALALMRSPASGAPAPADPLGELVAHKGGAASKKPRPLDADDVTFPEVLTDQDHPTTAMEAVRRRAPAAAPAPPPEGLLPDRPPPATDRLPVVPLPAQDMVGRATVKVAAEDTLGRAARRATQEPSGELAEAGRAGGYQLQVSSFQSQEEAEAFATALRRRGHKAHVETAHVKGRGLWYRVRVGPFKYKRSAQIYRQDFEAKERMVTFIVDPPKTKVSIKLAEDER